MSISYVARYRSRFAVRKVMIIFMQLDCLHFVNVLRNKLAIALPCSNCFSAGLNSQCRPSWTEAASQSGNIAVKEFIDCSVASFILFGRMWLFCKLQTRNMTFEKITCRCNCTKWKCQAWCTIRAKDCLHGPKQRR